jgi:hypothetical protein
VALNDQAKQYCFDSFVTMGLDYIPSETNFFMVDVGDAAHVGSELAARDIKVRSGWGMPKHLRVSTGTMAEMEDFITALEEILAGMSAGNLTSPRVTALYGNVPNPVPGGTRISYALAEAGPVLLQIFDIRGRLVRTLVDRHQAPGRHALEWDGTDQNRHRLPGGSYFYRLRQGEVTQTRRLILL